MISDWPDRKRQGEASYDVIVPPTNGMNFSGSPLNILPEYAQVLLNCYYSGDNRLILGRPGSTKLTSTGISDQIYDIIQVNVEYVLPTYTVMVATDSALYGYDESSDIFTKIGNLEGIPYCLGFNKNLVICDGGQLKSWNGAHLYVRGAHFNVVGEIEAQDITASVTMSSSDYTLVGNEFTTPNDGYYRRLISVYVYLKNESSATRDIVIELRSGGVTGTALTTSEAVSSASITSSWTLQKFSFVEPGYMAPNTTYGLVIDYDESDAIQVGQYSNAAGKVTRLAKYNGTSWTYDTANAALMSINGIYEPKPRMAVVYKERLVCLRDNGGGENKARIYYSNVNNLDDFYTTDGGGYFVFADDSTSEVMGGGLYAGSLLVTGYVNNDPVTLLYYGNLPNLRMQSIYHGGAAENWRTVCSTVNEIFFLDKAGVLSGTGTVDFGDMRWSPISKQIWVQLQHDIDWSETIIATNRFMVYVPRYGQVWLVPDWYNNQGTREDPRIYVLDLITKAWTWYKFNFNVSAVRQIDNTIYMGSQDGHLYKLDEDAIGDDGTSFDVIYRPRAIVRYPFVNKMLRRFIIDLSGLTPGTQNTATIKLYKDFKYNNEVFREKVNFSDNQSSDLSFSLKNHKAHIGFTAIQFSVEDVSERAIAGPIMVDVTTYGHK